MKTIYYTNKGRKRTGHEDGLLIGEETKLESMDSPVAWKGSPEKLCVADGMGGTELGEIATRVLLSQLASTPIGNAEELKALIERSQEEIAGIDTGCAAAGLILGDEPFAFNIGDCRVYRKEDIFLNRITRDHTVVQALIDRGEIDEEEALIHPRRHVLTSALSPTVEEVNVYTKRLSLRPGDIYLICTDGLWGEFGIEELEECFAYEGIERIGESLMAVLEGKEQADNVSYILLEVEK